MKAKVLAAVVVAVALLAGCATSGVGVAEVATNLDEYDEQTVTVTGEVGRGLRVTGAFIYLVLLEEEGYRAPLLSAKEYEYGQRVSVTGTVFAYQGETFDEMGTAAQEALTELVNEIEEGPEEDIQVFVDSTARFLKTYAIGSEANFFIIEESADE